MAGLDSARLQKDAAELNVTLTAPVLDGLARYADMVRKWNVAFNLVSRNDVARLQDRHLLDSLAAGPYLAGACVLDVGSGAGLPGLPLAIAYPDRQFVLCERMARRSRFLKQVVNAIGIENVEIQDGPVESLQHRLFDVITARGVVPPDKLWAMTSRLLSAHGRVLVYASTQARVPNLESDNRCTVTYHHYEIPQLQRVHTLIQMRRPESAGAV